jgi:GNAT superfamily N-acetyltransferase
MSMEFSIRVLEPHESDLVLPLLEVVQAVHSSARPDVFRVDTDRIELSNFLQEWLAGPQMTALVATTSGGRACGYLVFEVQERERQPLHQPSRRGFLHHVCTDPLSRRVGIATALIEAMKQRLHALGIERVATAYWAFNTPSAALMTKAGFKPFRIVAEVSISEQC